MQRAGDPSQQRGPEGGAATGAGARGGCDANYPELNDGLYFRSERDAFGNTRPLVAPAKKPMRIRVTGGPLTKPFDVIAFHTLEAIKFCVQAHGVGAYKAAVQK